MRAPPGTCAGSSMKRPVRRTPHRCSAVHRRLSGPRARMTSRRSASSSAQSFRIRSGSISSGAGSAIEIERGLFDVPGEILGRGAGVDGGGIEAFVAEQLGQFDQLARMLTQPGQGEGVAKVVGGNAGALE